jgi:hypothetical protein
MTKFSKNEILDRYEHGRELFQSVVSRINVRRQSKFASEDGILEQLMESPPEGKPLTVFYMRETSDGRMNIEKMFFTKKLESD